MMRPSSARVALLPIVVAAFVGLSALLEIYRREKDPWSWAAEACERPGEFQHCLVTRMGGGVLTTIGFHLVILGVLGLATVALSRNERETIA